MQLFYDPAITPGSHELRPAEAQHAARALRKRVGDTLDLVDGRGGWYRADIAQIDKRRCLVDATLQRREDRRAPHRTTLLVAPPKNIDRFEWILEKCTEIGIDVIQPILTEHSERNRLRNDRLERVLEAAMKQSLRAWLPELRELVPLMEVLNNYAGAVKYLAYLGQEQVPLLKDAHQRGSNVVLGIGPEGGFSPAEAGAAREAGFSCVSLGPHRLRTETAAIAAVHTIEMAAW